MARAVFDFYEHLGRLRPARELCEIEALLRLAMRAPGTRVFHMPGRLAPGLAQALRRHGRYGWRPTHAPTPALRRKFWRMVLALSLRRPTRMRPIWAAAEAAAALENTHMPKRDIAELLYQRWGMLLMPRRLRWRLRPFEHFSECAASH